ncbi:hypothetical protein K3495_g4582 [Podosphaera aphanis]|nr:hypothetical protein K3495_g4582 [Podosphaera aphanis]
MICTSVISNIDSLLANFNEEIEKEKGIAFQTYFRQVISLFVASEAAPTPPPAPTYSRPSKGSKINKTNFSYKSAVVAVPHVALAPVRAGKQTQTSVSNIPSKPVATENFWATVVRNGHKKVRAASAETSSAGQNKPNEQQRLSTPKKVLH